MNHWTHASGRFAKLARRERALLVSAAVVVVVGFGYLSLIDPAVKHRNQLMRQIDQQQTDVDALKREIQTLRLRLDPNAALRAQAESLRQQLRGAEDEFDHLQQALVPPQEMGQLLEGLLVNHRGLQLVRLRSLPAVSLTELQQPGPDKGAAAPDRPASGVPAGGTAAGGMPAAGSAGPRDEPWLYRHGVEITVRGNYADMLVYLVALEALPRRLYWGELKIAAQAYPATVMTVTVYTVSLEKSWWIV